MVTAKSTHYFVRWIIQVVAATEDIYYIEEVETTRSPTRSWSLLLTLGAHAHSEGYSSCRVCVYVCVYVCMCVCVYVWPLITAASHIGITKQRYQRVHSNTAIVLNFADFPKNALFKSYGVICLPRAAPAS